MEKGNIILLTGVTSAGKSTLAIKLQEMFDEPYYYIAEDTFNEVICPFAAGKGKFFDPEIMGRAISVMYEFIRIFSDRGLNVIVDHVMLDGERIHECVGVLYEHPVMLVRVKCDRGELLDRARRRGYTTFERLSQIDQQLSKSRTYDVYDLAVDTTTTSPEENAQIIKRKLRDRDQWNAFRRLKALFDQEPSA